MELNLQISNWLVAVFGGLASWVVIAASVLLALSVFSRVRLLYTRREGLSWLLDRSLVIRYLSLLFFIWVLIGFNSNAPKFVLAPDYSAEQRAIENALEKDAGEVRDLSPQPKTAEETSERLRKLREEEKAEVLGGEE